MGVSNCRFCLENNMLHGTVLAANEQGYVIKLISNPDCLLIIPRLHIEAIDELADNWWQAVKQLLSDVPLISLSYNISINIGREAGQTVKHLHFWYIPRYGDQIATGKGLMGLITSTNTKV